MTAILGLSAFYHDSAAALLIDGKIVAAAQEERFSRKKHDPGFPIHSIRYALSHSNISLAEIDYVAFYDKPILKFDRLLETYIAKAPRGFKSFCASMPIWMREKLFLKKMLSNELGKLHESFNPERLYFAEHHMSHLASAFYPSGFDEAVVLSLDGVGEWATTTAATGSGSAISIEKEIHFPHSLGLLYSAFTYYTGFKVNSGEYKLMGLAPYGEPRYDKLILDEIIDVKEDGSFRLNQSYFNYSTGLTMTNDRFADLFGQPVREPEVEPLTQFHMDIAASVQKATECVVSRMTQALAREYAVPNLCLAGGVALNCVANGKIQREESFTNIWIQPAAGDAGGALGAALAMWHQELNNPRSVSKHDDMQGTYLGPEFKQSAIEDELRNAGAAFSSLSEQEVIEVTAEALIDQQAIGWFQGRMEFGPRALGARSILGDPRSESMQKTLNMKVKFRESFRPFAPAVLSESVDQWFDLSVDSPYMLLVASVKKDKTLPMTEEQMQLFGIDKLNIRRSDVPAITHVDYSARIQTVHKEFNPRFHALISAFNKRTGCPLLVNTSFNVRGEPIVCTPTDAFHCFMGTDLDQLVIGNCVLHKSDQNPELKQDYKDRYDLD